MHPLSPPSNIAPCEITLPAMPTIVDGLYLIDMPKPGKVMIPVESFSPKGTRTSIHLLQYFSLPHLFLSDSGSPVGFLPDSYWNLTIFLKSHFHIFCNVDSYWNPTGILLDSYWTPTGLLLDSYWTPTGLQLNLDKKNEMLQLDSYWIPTGLLLDSYWSIMHSIKF